VNFLEIYNTKDNNNIILTIILNNIYNNNNNPNESKLSIYSLYLLDFLFFCK
jgi:hypothetical protein